MKLFGIAACCLAAGAQAAVPAWDELSADYSFKQYMADFNKTYASASEESKRRVVFEINRNLAVQHNADPTHTWKQGVNQFSDRTQGEFRGSHGYVPPTKFEEFEDADLQIPHDFDLSSLPTSVDWRTSNVVTAIKNQGGCGSCWAFASTEQIESYVALDKDGLPTLSPQSLVSCSKNPNHCGGTGGCEGSIAELAYQFVKQSGMASEQDYPYTSGTSGQTGSCKKYKSSATVGGYKKLATNNYTEVMYALANVGPVAVNVDAMPMQSYSTGVFSGCQKSSTDIDHVVQLVGYGHDSSAGKDYWILRNSWGTGWGMDGYMHLERHSSEEWCGIDTKPEDGTGCTGGPKTVQTCGSCGVIYDVSYPTGAKAVH